MIPAAAPTSAPHRRGGGTHPKTTSRGAPERLPLAKDPEKLSVTKTVTEPSPTGQDTRRAELLAQVRAERGRRQAVLAAIRAHLDEQPSTRSVRTCARRWCDTITNLADDVVTAKNNREAA